MKGGYDALELLIHAHGRMFYWKDIILLNAVVRDFQALERSDRIMSSSMNLGEFSITLRYYASIIIVKYVLHVPIIPPYSI